jgi:hypothetical protein
VFEFTVWWTTANLMPPDASVGPFEQPEFDYFQPAEV